MQKNIIAVILEKENIHTTQATISRDIRELNLNKVDNGQGEAYFV
jgi:transcriptional regulator of arginine metabolism